VWHFAANFRGARDRFSFGTAPGRSRFASDLASVSSDRNRRRSAFQCARRRDKAPDPISFNDQNKCATDPDGLATSNAAPGFDMEHCSRCYRCRTRVSRPSRRDVVTFFVSRSWENPCDFELARWDSPNIRIGGGTSASSPKLQRLS
jgi:hypothetical protein